MVLSERTVLQLRAEFFNIANRPQYARLGTTCRTQARRFRNGNDPEARRIELQPAGSMGDTFDVLGGDGLRPWLTLACNLSCEQRSDRSASGGDTYMDPGVP